MSGSLVHALRLRVIGEQGLTVTTAGTPVVVPANKYAEAVRFINNNIGVVVAVGLADTVDAVATPEIGTALDYRDQHIEYCKPTDLTSVCDELYVDADTNATKVTIQYMGY